MDATGAHFRAPVPFHACRELIVNSPDCPHRRLRRACVGVMALLLCLPVSGAAQAPEAGRADPYFATFSIVAVDRATGETGVAVATRVPCVGNTVPHVRAGVGAVATQAAARIEYGMELLDLLEQGLSPEAALQQAMAADPQRVRRQVAIIAADGRSAQHTGTEAHPWAGHRSGRNYVTQGNLLVGPAVLQAVARRFESTEGSGRRLADRLIDALAAGEAAGGDARKGVAQSAAVVIADPRPGRSHRPNRVSTDIDVCEHPNPVAELRRIYDAVTETLGYRTLQQFNGADVFQLRLMLHALGYYRPGLPEPRPDLTSHFYTADLVTAVNAFREAEKLGGPEVGSPPGLVDQETVERLWAALRRRGLADAVRARIQDVAEQNRF
ncbi:MAG TPA: DUF1028 domain-containing protein [Longimicrobiales bacterium]|nr:DUF1028 domain-containing protein [Longimicrobiales bacterium]